MFKPIREGLLLLPDMGGWSKVRQLGYKISSPSFALLFSDNKPGVINFLYILWFPICILALELIGWSLENVFDPPIVQETQRSSSPIVEIIISIIALLLAALSLTGYWRWIEFWRDRRYPALARVLLTAIFFFFIVALLYLLFMLEDRSSAFSYSAVLFDPAWKVMWLVFIIFGFPALTFTFFLVLDLVIWIPVLTIKFVLYIAVAHDPLPREQIFGLLHSPIASSNGDWKLLDLSSRELKMLAEWSAVNREGTDKRLIPTAIFFAVVSVLANTEAFSNLIVRILTFAFGSFNFGNETGMSLSEFYVRYIVMILIATLFTGFMLAMLSLFRNLVVQSVIQETCLLAGFAVEQHEKTLIVKRVPFWQRIFQLLFMRR